MIIEANEEHSFFETPRSVCLANDNHDLERYFNDIVNAVREGRFKRQSSINNGKGFG